MVYFLASLTRSISKFLVTKDNTYYLGMIIIRMGRWFRKVNFNSKNQPDFQTVDMIYGNRIYIDRFSYMGGMIFWTGSHHHNEAIFLHYFLTSDMTFVDIGANQGEMSLIAASKIKSGHIFAFEPVSHQRKLLEINKKINDFKNIEIYSFGLGNCSSSQPIYTSDDTSVHSGMNEGLSSLYSSSDRNILQEVIQIKVFDDLFFNDLERLDFIKIDVEGAELFALEGMVKSIQKFKPVILIEINEETFKAANYTTKDIVDFFDNLNYGFFEIKKGKLVNTEVKSFEKWGNYIVKYKK